jgi:hypothetical protein
MTIDLVSWLRLKKVYTLSMDSLPDLCTTLILHVIYHLYLGGSPLFTSLLLSEAPGKKEAGLVVIHRALTHPSTHAQVPLMCR